MPRSVQAANKLLTALYAHNDVLRRRCSAVAGITHPYLNVGRIEGGSNTNVVPGKVVLKLDRRMIPEEDAVAVEENGAVHFVGCVLCGRSGRSKAKKKGGRGRPFES